jgi:predicted anti-sigma-YlaC factor YlaD
MKQFMQKIMGMCMPSWMRRCDKVSTLVVQDLDTPLSPFKKKGVQMHLSMCPPCKHYANQMAMIQAGILKIEQIHAQGEPFVHNPSVRLSQEARDRIQKSISPK